MTPASVWRARLWTALWTVGVLAAAIGGRLALHPLLGSNYPVVLLFGAIAVGVWVGGLWPAVVIAIVGYVASNLLFLTPYMQWGPFSTADIIGAVGYAISAAIIITFGVQLRAARAASLQAQEEYAAQASLLRMTLSSIGDAVVTTDDAGGVTFMNAVAERLSGWTLAEASGAPLHEVVQTAPVTPPDVWARAVGAVHAADTQGRAGRKTPGAPVLLRERSGAEHLIESSTAPIEDSAGRSIGYVMVFRDVTVQRAAQEALAASARMKDEFLALLSHELRNPLAPLRNAVDVLRHEPATSPAASAMHAMMDRQLTHLVRLVDDLMDVSRITSGRLDIRRELVPVACVVEAAIETTASLVAEYGHTLHAPLPDHAVAVSGDPIRLSQVITNLLTNAARYTPAGGTITLDVTHDAHEVHVAVRDTGVGIPPDELPHLFEMFRRGAHALATRDGLGIGLALAAQLVTLHGGRIDAASDGPGRGSTFTVHLPRAHAPTATAADATGSDAGVLVPARRHRVLVVDDNVDAADTLGMLLGALGAEAVVAHSGDDAIAQCARFAPDLVLLDLGMPGMTGFEVLSRLRASATQPQPRVLALTGWGQAADRQRVAAAGFDGHLVKPVDLATLQGLLHDSPPA